MTAPSKRPPRVFAIQRAIRAADNGLTGDQRLVLFVLSTYLGKRGAIFPSGRTIASQCGIGRSTFHRVETALVESGWLQVRPRYDDDGRRTSNHYRITPPSLAIKGEAGEPAE